MGNKWYPLNDGLPNPYISALAANNEYVYVGMLGGIWRMPLNDAVASARAEGESAASQFQLAQNYPNPFNPVTTIKYTVAGNRDQGSGISDVKITVYDVLGREVAVLVNERKAPGTYTVTFSARGGSASGGDGTGLASGVYIYRLSAGGFVQSRKALLMK